MGARDEDTDSEDETAASQDERGVDAATDEAEGTTAGVEKTADGSVDKASKPEADVTGAVDFRGRPLPRGAEPREAL